MTDAILALDLGTSRVKATLFAVESDSLRELDQTSAGYRTYTPGPGLAEQRPADWWAATAEAVRALWRRGADPTTVGVISVTGQMHGLVPVDQRGTALGPCLTLRDRRASKEAEWLRRTLGHEQIFRVTGAQLDASSPVAKLLWYRRHMDWWGAIRTVLAPKDWLRQQLTGGEPLTDPIEAAGMVMYDVQRGAWSPTMIAAVEASPDRLPVVQAPTEIAGRLRAFAADALGMAAGCPVAVGAADDVEFIGAGLLCPGDCMEHLGSTGSLLLVTDHVVDDPTGTLEIYPHLLPGRWLIGGSTSSAGAALDWLRAALRSETRLRVPAVNGKTPPIFVPYLAGERSPIWEPDARAVFWGLGIEHGLEDLIRAAFEGVAFSLRHLLDALASSGPSPAEIHVAPSSDAGWLALRASVYGRPLRILRAYDPTALGAALVGAVALHVYPDLEQAAEAIVQPGERIEPDESASLSARYIQYQWVSSMIQQSLIYPR